MVEKIKLYDESKCTACRGCQVACKQWNGLPASQTVNYGSYQNPPDLQTNTWMLIQFQEVSNGNGKVTWHFRKDACMHCTDAGCVKVCPSGALFRTELGSVGLHKDKCIGCKECIYGCPFDVPRYDAKTDKIAKCDLCFSRISRGMDPACVKACPTGALSFGEKKAMIAKAHGRAKQLGGNATVYGDQYLKGTHMMFVLTDKPAVYARLPERPRIPLSVIAWKDWFKPLTLVAAGAVVAGSFLHYILHGPKDTTGDDRVGQEGGE